MRMGLPEAPNTGAVMTSMYRLKPALSRIAVSTRVVRPFRTSVHQISPRDIFECRVLIEPKQLPSRAVHKQGTAIDIKQADAIGRAFKHAWIKASLLPGKFGLPPFRYVEDTADITEEGSVRCKSWLSDVNDAGVIPVGASKTVLGANRCAEPGRVGARIV